MQVLIVDDDPLMLHLSRKVVARLGHQVFNRPGDLRAAYARDGAETARVAAAFGDFQISRVRRAEAQAGRGQKSRVTL